MEPHPKLRHLIQSASFLPHLVPGDLPRPSLGQVAEAVEGASGYPKHLCSQGVSIDQRAALAAVATSAIIYVSLALGSHVVSVQFRHVSDVQRFGSDWA